MNVQGFADAIGDLNLDFYPVRVTALPTVAAPSSMRRDC